MLTGRSDLFGFIFLLLSCYFVSVTNSFSLLLLTVIHQYFKLNLVLPTLFLFTKETVYIRCPQLQIAKQQTNTKLWRYRNNGAADFLFQRHLFGCQTQRLDGDGRTRLNSTGCECVHGQVMSGFLTRQSVTKEMHSSFLVGLGCWIFSPEDISDTTLACGSHMDQTLFQNEREKSSTVK